VDKEFCELAFHEGVCSQNNLSSMCGETCNLCTSDKIAQKRNLMTPIDDIVCGDDRTFLYKGFSCLSIAFVMQSISTCDNLIMLNFNRYERNLFSAHCPKSCKICRKPKGNSQPYDFNKIFPSEVPSITMVSEDPSVTPSGTKTRGPSAIPSAMPSITPSERPSKMPSTNPLEIPISVSSKIFYNPTIGKRRCSDNENFSYKGLRCDSCKRLGALNLRGHEGILFIMNCPKSCGSCQIFETPHVLPPHKNVLIESKEITVAPVAFPSPSPSSTPLSKMRVPQIIFSANGCSDDDTFIYKDLTCRSVTFFLHFVLSCQELQTFNFDVHEQELFVRRCPKTCNVCLDDQSPTATLLGSKSKVYPSSPSLSVAPSKNLSPSPSSFPSIRSPDICEDDENFSLYNHGCETMGRLMTYVGGCMDLQHLFFSWEETEVIIRHCPKTCLRCDSAVPTTRSAVPPSSSPLSSPSSSPSSSPPRGRRKTDLPSWLPSGVPSAAPSEIPIILPSVLPSVLSSEVPSFPPSEAPSVPYSVPSSGVPSNPKFSKLLLPSYHTSRTSPSRNPAEFLEECVDNSSFFRNAYDCWYVSYFVQFVSSCHELGTFHFNKLDLLAFVQNCPRSCKLCSAEVEGQRLRRSNFPSSSPTAALPPDTIRQGDPSGRIISWSRVPSSSSTPSRSSQLLWPTMAEGRGEGTLKRLPDSSSSVLPVASPIAIAGKSIKEDKDVFWDASSSSSPFTNATSFSPSLSPLAPSSAANMKNSAGDTLSRTKEMSEITAGGSGPNLIPKVGDLTVLLMCFGAALVVALSCSSILSVWWSYKSDLIYFI